MRTYIEKEVKTKKLDRAICDICYKDITHGDEDFYFNSGEEYENNNVTLHINQYNEYPDCDNKLTSYDVCPECFKYAIEPLMRGKPSIKENQFP